VADSRCPRRPVYHSSIDRVAEVSLADEWAAEGLTDVAHSTAVAVITAGRDGRSEASRMREIIESVGLETLRELWQKSPRDTLPGALWILCLLRTWCKHNAVEVSRLYAMGKGLAPVDEVVAGASDDADPETMKCLAEEILQGAYQGDLAVALERAASFFRIVAAGRRFFAADGALGVRYRMLAERNIVSADALQRVARRGRTSQYLPVLPAHKL
jgi:hypothetical protein